LFIVGFTAAPAPSYASRPTVSLSGTSLLFFPGHLLLDAHGQAFLDDGVLHVTADHIALDLRAKRYIAVGNVAVRTSDPVAGAGANGDVFGEDIAAHRGLLVALDVTPTERVIEGSTFSAPHEVETGTPASEPLAMPDFGDEIAFASASHAVVHIGADVRLTNTKVLVPGSKSLRLPSYVYMYSSDPGYTVSNFAGASEDVPVYFGSTRNSVQGIHFLYRPDVKFSFGLDERIVNGPKGYVLISGAPLTGSSKAATLTWQDQINGHTQQTLTSTAIQGFGTTNQYDVRDGVHRSFFELSATQFQSNVFGQFAWQGYDEALAHGGALSHLSFHLRSEYGVLHTPLELGFSPLPSNVYLPQYIFHYSGEAYVATQPLTLGPSTTVYASADARYTHDTLPHNLSTQTYSLTLNQRANRFVTLGASISDTPIEDGYPSVGAVYASRFDTETATFSYNHSRYYSMLLTGTHATASTQLPNGVIVTPWSTSADVRFRVLPTLSVELGRSYYFGFEGQRFGTWTFQIFP
jgi:hypothetical protein